MKQLTKDEALKFAQDKKYLFMSNIEIAKFQIQQDRMCMPFGVFITAVNKSLDTCYMEIDLMQNRESITKELLSK